MSDTHDPPIWRCKQCGDDYVEPSDYDALAARLETADRANDILKAQLAEAERLLRECNNAYDLDHCGEHHVSEDTLRAVCAFLRGSVNGSESPNG